MITRRIEVLIALCWLLSTAASSQAAILGLERVASGLSAPIFVTHAPGDASRLFIVERGSPAESASALASIRILNLNTGQLDRGTFLTTTVDNRGEGGFLGMAFHPDYFNSGTPGFGKFYVNVTTASPFTTRIREFQVSATNPNAADAASMREIISYAQPQTNHNGGWIGFSPNDGYLYIASGDGGGGNDDDAGHTAGTGNAQDTTNNLLGKMLRIDVDGDDFPADAARNYAIPPSNPFRAGVGDPGDDVGDDEIWSYGLRNPFRASFDRLTGDLWIGDVGQGQREEIDFQPASSTGAENYGWRLREGLTQTPNVGGQRPPGNVDPVYEYNRDNDQFGGTVVSGGYVYRGPDPSLQGKYFFLDSRSTAPTGDDNYWMFDPANPFGTVMNIDSLLTPDVGSVMFPVSFGEDAIGNLYIAYIASGEVYRIATTVIPEPSAILLAMMCVWPIGLRTKRHRD
jgi:glucose/arabinose dehydrogenase